MFAACDFLREYMSVLSGKDAFKAPSHLVTPDFIAPLEA